MQNFITLGQPLPGEKHVAEKKYQLSYSTPLPHPHLRLMVFMESPLVKKQKHLSDWIQYEALKWGRVSL